MKLCKDCVHCSPFIDDTNGVILFHHCTLRSPKHDFNPVTGSFQYWTNTAVYCQSERKDSTGFFGLFIDEDRCGVEAKNFVPKGENK